MNNTINFTSNKNRLNFLYDVLLSLKKTGWEGKYEYEYNDNDNDNINETISINKCYGLTLEQYINNYEYLDIKSTLHLVLCIGIQINILKEHNLGISHFSLSDIIVIDKFWFILNPDSDNILNLNNNDEISIKIPLNNNEYIAPEIYSINTLPYNLYYTSAYYSLALICMKAMNLKYNKNDTSEIIKNELNKINYSQLYFILERCLTENPKDRYFIII